MDWTEADSRLAIAFGLGRIKSLFPEMESSLLWLDLENKLHIYTSDDASAIALKPLFSVLQYQAWLSLGCLDVSLWLDDELIAQSRISIESSIANTCNDTDESMSTATVEKQTTQTATPYSSPQALQGQILATIAQKVRQPIESVRAWIQEQGAEIIPLGKEEVISGSVAVQALNHFFEVLRQQEMANLGLLQNGFTMPEPEPETPEPEATATNGNGKAAVRSTQTRMALPRTFSRNIAKSIPTNLDRALPKDSRLRKLYLEQIAAESEAGLAFLNSAAGLIVAKNGGDKTKIAASLLTAAKKLAAKTA